MNDIYEHQEVMAECYAEFRVIDALEILQELELSTLLDLAEAVADELDRRTL